MLIWLLIGGILCSGFGLILILFKGGWSRPDDDDAPSEFEAGMVRWEGVNYENLR